LLWRDPHEAESCLRQSQNWVHARCRVEAYQETPVAKTVLPAFSLHIHAFYPDDLAADIRRHAAFKAATRIVVTTDTPAKEQEIADLMAAEGLRPEIVLVPNVGRDILPFLELFGADGVAGTDEIWGHIHQKKSLASTVGGDVWRKFLLRILMGDAEHMSSALTQIASPEVGLVAPMDPHFVGWGASRRLLPRFAPRLADPLPEHPLLFPVGNMFWVRRPVVQAMRALFGARYPWPQEPIPNDGTEYHLMERLWPTMAAQCGQDTVFLHKMDEQRR
jgi:lipopolysaccharide biosynthesis protein